MIIGIDPGISGAFAFLEAYLTETGGFPHAPSVVDVQDMPTVNRAKKGNAQMVDGYGLKRILTQHGPIDHAYLELVKGMPRQAGGGSKMGATSAFNFGGSFHGVRIALEVLGIPYTLVPPEVWKKRAGLAGAEKDYSRTRALQLFPHASEQLKRKKDVGRAEAILIAKFGPAP